MNWQASQSAKALGKNKLSVEYASIITIAYKNEYVNKNHSSNMNKKIINKKRWYFANKDKAIKFFFLLLV